MSDMTFQPQLVLDSNGGDMGKNYPISLRIYSLESDKTELYRLRYRAFLDAGWIPANAECEFVDRYDGLPSTFAVGAFHNRACIGSLRLAFGGEGYQAHSMPCEEQFANEIHALDPARRNRTVEFSRMAVEPSLDNRSFRTTLYASLIRAGVILSDAADMDVALIAVHRKTSPFYQAMCGFKVAGKSDFYLGINEPTDFLTLQFSEIKKRRMRVNSFFAFSEQELASARQAMSELVTRAA
jgi:N-acyl-L-homoserine lactone synthetase